jgi:hypothetical protein
MNDDFVDLLRALSEAEVRFLVVGAYALAIHGHPRATGDLDVWVEPSSENADRVFRGLQRFGAPLTDVTAADFARPRLVYQIGLPPRRIDVLTDRTGLTFEEAWPERLRRSIAGVEVDVIGRAAYIRNKRATGRPQDLADVARLEGSS